MNPDAPKPKLTAEQKLVMQILTSKARGKQHYATAGAKASELRAICPVGTAVILPDGRRFCFVDNAADKEVMFKNVGFDRYELKEMKG